jgi:hypothetical protein
MCIKVQAQVQGSENISVHIEFDEMLTTLWINVAVVLISEYQAENILKGCFLYPRYPHEFAHLMRPDE